MDGKRRYLTTPPFKVHIVLAGLLVALLAFVPLAGLGETAQAGGSDRGRLVVLTSGMRGRGEPVCVTLRDLTEDMVVGSYCDNEQADRDARVGRIDLDLPRRSFAIDARMPGGEVVRITPKRFDLGALQTVVVRFRSAAS